jgi:hypothetical protein
MPYIMLDRPEMGRSTELELGGLAGDVVVAADHVAEASWERVNDAHGSHVGRYHDKGAIAAVFAEASRPWDTGAVERSSEYLVELLVQVQTNFVVTARAGESSDVDREHCAYLARLRRIRLYFSSSGGQYAFDNFQLSLQLGQAEYGERVGHGDRLGHGELAFPKLG